MSKYNTIENAKYAEGYSVYEIGTYGRSSVLAGQTKKTLVEIFDTIEEAKECYPKADFGYFDANNTFGHLPGSDHLDGQGGAWGE
jgi:hypothetical protein